MTDEPEAVEEATQETVAEETVNEVSSEDIARERGWKPSTEWKGPIPDNFIDDPDQFNENHEKSNHRLKKEARELSETIARMSNQLNSMEGWIEKRDKSDKEGRLRDLEKLRTEMAKAVQTGDVKAAEAVATQREQINKDITQTTETKANDDQAYVDGLQNQFNAENAWYDTSSPDFDQQKTTYANQVASQMINSGRVAVTDGKRFFNDIAAAVDTKFKETKPVTTPSKVEGGRRAARKTTKGDKWASLPADVRKGVEDNGILKRLYKGDKDKYAKDYFADQET